MPTWLRVNADTDEYSDEDRDDEDGKEDANGNGSGDDNCLLSIIRPITNVEADPRGIEWTPTLPNSRLQSRWLEH